MQLKNVVPWLLLLSGATQAQVLTFAGDGFEACPRGAMAVESRSSLVGLFGPFPQISPNNRFGVPLGSSWGLQLTAPNALTSGQLGAQLDTTTGEAVLSLSPCAAVYPPNPASCVSAVSATPSLQWTTDPAGAGCRLQPGNSYYFNITFGTQTAPGDGQPWCSSASCGVTLVSTSR
jgi:hypothetical protein